MCRTSLVICFVHAPEKVNRHATYAWHCHRFPAHACIPRLCTCAWSAFACGWVDRLQKNEGTVRPPQLHLCHPWHRTNGTTLAGRLPWQPSCDSAEIRAGWTNLQRYRHRLNTCLRYATFVPLSQRREENVRRGNKTRKSLYRPTGAAAIIYDQLRRDGVKSHTYELHM